ncbi:MAG: hypothetical protein ThorAB25_25170 [Candidatus Thorarchaeota archaeon AB_25]|nr:MAG: hypothetical protein ThorAB25_25170 [Candidatus Thorarchaeota archaeon AB_25]
MTTSNGAVFFLTAACTSAVSRCCGSRSGSHSAEKNVILGTRVPVIWGVNIATWLTNLGNKYVNPMLEVWKQGSSIQTELLQVLLMRS